MSIEMNAASSTASAPLAAHRAFLGWRIVGVAFLAQFLANGVTLAAFSNFVLPLSQPAPDGFGVPRSTITLGLTIAIGSIGLMSPIVGRMLDRGRAKTLMTTGSFLAGAGLIWMSQIEDFRLFAVVYALMVCLGAAFFGPMPSMTIVANWFITRRGFALGLTFAGATIISAVGPVAAQYLIDTSGWRTAVLTFGIVVLVIGVPSFAALAIGRPEDVGQLPDGEAPSDEPSVVSEILSVQQLARDPRLWLISLGFGLLMTSPIVLLSLIVPYGEDLGFSGAEANAFLVAAMPFSLIGKIVLGTLVDRAPAKPIIALIVIANVLCWLIFYSVPSYALFVVCGAIYGIGIGGVAPVQGVVMGRCFGRANFGSASGLGGILAILLLILATLMSSFLQGENGEGYPTIFITQTCLIALGGLVLGLLRIPGVADSVEASPSVEA